MKRDILPDLGKTKAIALAIAVLAALACLSQLGWATNADAGGASPAATIGFCGNVEVGNHGDCSGGPVDQVYQIFGYGDEHSVCVEIDQNASTQRCSSGPGAGVYSAEVAPQPAYGTIRNNADGATHVHADFLTTS